MDTGLKRCEHCLALLLCLKPCLTIHSCQFSGQLVFLRKGRSNSFAKMEEVRPWEYSKTTLCDASEAPGCSHKSNFVPHNFHLRYLGDLHPLTVGAWTINSFALKPSSCPDELITINPILCGILPSWAMWGEQERKPIQCSFRISHIYHKTTSHSNNYWF